MQQHPSAAVFPGGESMRGMQHASRRGRAGLERPDRAENTARAACFVVCSHGDIIKSVLADALGMHLDLFQRIAVGPCSVTVIRYTPLRPFVLRLGETGELGSVVPADDGPAPGTLRRARSPDGRRRRRGGGRRCVSGRTPCRPVIGGRSRVLG